ncbi:hypothetical protein OU5_1741 [Pseudomonas mandelii JR-1]|uniref:Uncharacterized protein n=1 Tax=Pseudomonas mandelii JR-1 TaxID=1147786 RepID=A0A024E8E2_9PSED|nr:hypothetical protein OU5_1741 [Pseudomonas mandelii JR-1]
MTDFSRFEHGRLPFLIAPRLADWAVRHHRKFLAGRLFVAIACGTTTRHCHGSGITTSIS